MKQYIAVLYTGSPPEVESVGDITFELVKVQDGDDKAPLDIWCGWDFQGLIVQEDLKNTFIHRWMQSRVRNRCVGPN